MVRPMNTRYTALLLGLLPASCSLAASRTETAHFNFNVSVLEHGIRQSGSSTWRVSLTQLSNKLSINPSAILAGEAVPVRLQDGSWLLFLPLGEDGGWGDQWVLESFGIVPRRSSSPSAYPMNTFSTVRGQHGLTKSFLCYRGLPPDRGFIGRNSCPITLHSDASGRRESIKRLTGAELDAIGIPTAEITYSFSVSKGPVTYKLSSIIPWIDDLLLDPRSGKRGTNIYNVKPDELQYLRKPLGERRATGREES